MDIDENNDKITASKNPLLRLLWKQQTKIDINEVEKRLRWCWKWYSLYGFKAFQAGAMFAVFTIMLPLLGMLFEMLPNPDIAGHPPTLMSVSTAMWILSVGISTLIFFALWQIPLTRRVEALKKELALFADAASRLEYLIPAFREWGNKTEQELRHTVRVILEEFALELEKAKAEKIPSPDEEKRQSEIAGYRWNLKEIFDASKPFGLTEENWNPYFAEARKRLSIPPVQI